METVAIIFSITTVLLVWISCRVAAKAHIAMIDDQIERLSVMSDSGFLNEIEKSLNNRSLNPFEV